MLEIIKSQLTDSMSLEEKIHLVRENLQFLLLKILYDLDMYKKIAFVGGTALRILFDLRRFSEDIDFSLIDKKWYHLDKLIKGLEYQLKSYGFKIELKSNDQKIVHVVMVKFKDILYQLKLSPLKSQNLSIKIEIDTNPPPGFHTNISLISKFYTFTVTNYDLASLYSSKLCACFFRKYIKGRDFYDLLWYLGKKIRPNFLLLNNSIQQVQGINPNISETNFTAFLQDKIAKIDFNYVREDVERFIIDKSELRLLEKDILLQIISSDYKTIT